MDSRKDDPQTQFDPADLPRRRPLVVHREQSGDRKKVEVVLKCDSMGTEEAVVGSLEKVRNDRYEVDVIHADVGPVSKSDIFLALPAGKLVIGFNTGVMPRIETFCKEHGVEVRLYDVIYTLTRDLGEVLDSLVEPEEKERITGQGRVIALFKTGGKGVIIGVEVEKGAIALGKPFRIISAMGPVYGGTVESLQIERKPVTEAGPRDKAGIKIRDFKRVKIGDLVECFEPVKPGAKKAWRPRGGVFRFTG